MTRTPITTEQFLPVEKLPRGEYVRRTADAHRTYIRGDFDRASRRYALTDAEDVSRTIWVKRGTALFVGFTY